LVLIIGIDNLSGGASLKGVAFGLGAAALYATVILMNKHIQSVGGTDRTVLQFIAAVVVLLPYLLLTEGFHMEGMNGIGWLCLAIVSVVHTGLMYCLYFSSLRKLRGQEAAILSYIDPLVAVLISCTLLGEPISALQLVGGAMILGFTLVNELKPAAK
jgi:drug/metabolite transporter (DMT)-like permease